MEHSKIFLFLCIFVLAAASCGKDKDAVKPEIVDSGKASPVNCQCYRKGTVIPFRYTFMDNLELGNFNIEIHNNFDHHTHSTEAGDCPLDAKKAPVKPWVYNQDFSIPAGKTAYEAELDIPVPSDVDPGDYHFMIRLTDKAGWQQLKSVSLKVTE